MKETPTEDKRQILIKYLNEIGFRTTGDCTRKSISHYLEIAFMHFDGSFRLQTIGSGFTERLTFDSLGEVKAFIKSFEKHIVKN